MRRAEKVTALITGSLVGTFGLLAGYTAHGPFLSSPVVVTLPDAVLDAVCSDAIGCYLEALPDFIWLNAYGAHDPATLPHEMLHYDHPAWSECQVSAYLYETAGLKDGYHNAC